MVKSLAMVRIIVRNSSERSPGRSDRRSRQRSGSLIVHAVKTLRRLRVDKGISVAE